MAPTAPPSKLVHTLDAHKGPVHTAVYNSGAGYLLSGGSDRQIHLFNAKSGQKVKTYSGHGYEVLGIACTPDNTRFASCGGDRSVFLWDVTSGEIVRRMGGHVGKVNAVAWNSNATVLASGSFDTTIRLWDIKSSNRVPLQVLDESRDSITSIAIRDHVIVAGCVDGFVRTWDLRMGELRKDLFDQPVTSLTVTRDSSLVLVSVLSVPSPAPHALPPQKAAHHLLDLSNGQVIGTYTGHDNESYRTQSAFAGEAEEVVVSGDEKGCVRGWDVERGTAIGKPFKAHERAILWTSHHPKERQMVTASSDGTVKIWG
ncbi:hypothetical protein JCM10212_004299 [Sporobolomyces blumeae]